MRGGSHHGATREVMGAPLPWQFRCGFYGRYRGRSGALDQAAQVSALTNFDAAERHRQRDRQRQRAAHPHLGQPADEWIVEPERACQAAVDPLHGAALVVVILPGVAGARHRGEHAPILAERYAHRRAHRTLLHPLGLPRSGRQLIAEDSVLAEECSTRGDERVKDSYGRR